jgi:hypothetical protein
LEKVSANTSNLPNFGFQQLRRPRSIPHLGRSYQFLFWDFGWVKHLVEKFIEAKKHEVFVFPTPPLVVHGNGVF